MLANKKTRGAICHRRARPRSYLTSASRIVLSFLGPLLSFPMPSRSLLLLLAALGTRATDSLVARALPARGSPQPPVFYNLSECALDGVLFF